MEAVGKNPDLPQAWQALTVIAHEKKDWAKTLEYGQKALDLDPSNTKLYGMMTDAAEKSGDKKAAAAEKRDIARDRADMRKDKRDLRKDKRERREDVKGKS